MTAEGNEGRHAALTAEGNEGRHARLRRGMRADMQGCVFLRSRHAAYVLTASPTMLIVSTTTAWCGVLCLGAHLLHAVVNRHRGHLPCCLPRASNENRDKR